MYEDMNDSAAASRSSRSSRVTALLLILLAAFIATCILGLLATRALEPAASPTICPRTDVQLLDPTVIRAAREQAVWL